MHAVQERVEPYVVKALVEILLDMQTYNYTANIFAGGIGEKSNKLSVRSESVHALAKYFQLDVSMTDILNFGRIDPQPHFLHTCIRFMMSNLSKVEAVFAASETRTEFSRDELKSCMTTILELYPAYEIRYNSGVRLHVMQAETPNSLNTLQSQLLDKSNTSYTHLDSHNLNVAKRAAITFLESNHDFSLDPSSYDKPYPIGKSYGSRMAIFYKSAYSQGFVATSNAEIMVEGNSGEYKSSASEVFGGVANKTIPDIDLIDLRRLTVLSDGCFIGKSNALVQLTISLFFVTEELKASGVPIAYNLEPSAKMTRFKRYMAIIQYTIDLLGTSSNISEVMSKWREWDTFYSTVANDPNSANITQTCLQPLFDNERSVYAFSVLVACCLEYNKVRTELNEYGFRLVDMAIPTDMSAMGNTLLSHLTDLHGIKSEWYLDDPELDAFYGLLTNSAVSELVLELSGQNLRDYLRVNVDNCTAVNLSGVYMTEDLSLTHVAPVPEEATAHSKMFPGIIGLRVNSLMHKLSVLFVDVHATKTYRDMRNSLRAHTKITVPTNLLEKSTEIICTVKQVPSIASVLLTPNINNNPDAFVDAFDASIIELFAEFSGLFKVDLPLSCYSNPGTVVLNKMMLLQNYYFLNKSSDITAKLPSTSHVAMEQTIAYLIHARESDAESSYTFRGLSDCSSESQRELQQAVQRKCIPNSVMLESRQRAATIQLTLLSTRTASGIGLSPIVNSAKRYLKAFYAAKKVGDLALFVRDFEGSDDTNLLSPLLRSLVASAQSKGCTLDTNGIFMLNGLPLFSIHQDPHLPDNYHIEFLHYKGGIYKCLIQIQDSNILAELIQMGQ